MQPQRVIEWMNTWFKACSNHDDQPKELILVCIILYAIWSCPNEVVLDGFNKHIRQVFVVVHWTDQVACFLGYADVYGIDTHGLLLESLRRTLQLIIIKGQDTQSIVVVYIWIYGSSFPDFTVAILEEPNKALASFSTLAEFVNVVCTTKK